MGKREVVDIIRKALRSTPAGIPYVGPIYAKYLSDLTDEEMRQLLSQLKDASEAQYGKLMQEMRNEWEVTNEQLQLTVRFLEELLAKDQESSGLTAVIPCGGKAGHMFPFNSGMPKTLFILHTKPILHHILDSLRAEPAVFSRVIILVREFADAIEASVQCYGNYVQCIRTENDVPGALLEIEDKLDGPFLLHYNDILVEDTKWKQVYRRYCNLKESHGVVGMLLCSQHYPLGVGVITEHTDGCLETFQEKPERLAHGYASLGVAIFEPRFLRYVDRNHTSIYREGLKDAHDRGEKLGIYKVTKWCHIHSLYDYFDAQKSYYPEDM
jgi:NDP-sugar pyrophosphorylase family protein